MMYLFTSESVSEGHPDKVADQISDAILDDFLRQDPASRVACETFVSTGLAVVGGEVTSHDAYVDIQGVVRRTIRRIGYTKGEYHFDADSCAVISALHEQSADIARGVDRDGDDQGAGDQGMMFGYACNETPEFMPLPLTLAHMTLIELSRIRREENSPMPYLRPDAKCQFTVAYDDDHTPHHIHTLVLSTQHDPDVSQARIREDVETILLPRVKARLSAGNAALFKYGMILHVNPTGQFVIGGPHGDTGLTGRKIIVDTYGGRGAHGGGAFSGKDPSKVDRSAAYAARYIAKNMAAAGVADEILIQISYAIGVAKPVSIFVNTFGTSHTGMSDGEIAETVGRIFDLRPAAIVAKFGLTNPIYEPTAAYGHMGRDPFVKEVELIRDGRPVRKQVQFFGWELLDSVDRCRAAFNLKG
ncbi:MAG: methionine adenosyltransferase [Bacteroidales bacterium]|nr:methionine adenosyltransferase [Bacteroidales bacterium]